MSDSHLLSAQIAEIQSLHKIQALALHVLSIKHTPLAICYQSTVDLCPIEGREHMKRFLQSTLLAMSPAAFSMPSAVQARTYDVVAARIPFTFNTGNRAFRPCRYQFTLAGSPKLENGWAFDEPRFAAMDHHFQHWTMDRCASPKGGLW